MVIGMNLCVRVRRHFNVMIFTFDVTANGCAKVIRYTWAFRVSSPRAEKARETMRVTQKGNAAMAGKLKIRVDQDKCQGHARCKSLAPELFDLDEFGNAHEVGDGSVPAGLEDKAWLAQSNCPEIAIEVTEE